MYRSLLDKSMESMLSAVEIYNKPIFLYREESFSILAVNAWELLLKAVWLERNEYKPECLYETEYKSTKSGEKNKVNTYKFNRSGNKNTISLVKTINKLESSGFNGGQNLKNNIIALIELRDNSIHLYTTDIRKCIGELALACIKNYLQFIKNHRLPIDLEKYHFPLMPLAYVGGQTGVQGVLTDEESNYVNLLKECLKEDPDDNKYSVTVSIKIKFKKGNANDSAIGMRYDPKGIPVQISEEEILKKFPLTHAYVVTSARERYSDFKQTKEFHSYMGAIKEDKNLFHMRLLDPKNPKSAKKPFYSTNIWQVLDKRFTKKKS